MSAASKGGGAKVALIAMPWTMLNRPSIQLGVLKSWIEQQSSHQVTAHHPYLQIASGLGTHQYTVIAESSWGAEALFAALLFPEQYDGAHRTWKLSLGKKSTQLPDFKELVKTIDQVCKEWLTTVDWSPYHLIGFSLCFNQLFASLYIAKLLKNDPSCPPIVFGGSLCGGDLGQSLITAFSQIDYIVDGEGETPLMGLIDYVMGEASTLPERLFAKPEPAQQVATPEIGNLNDLPAPDYSDYFRSVQEIFPHAPFIPVVPVEFSRGCWWNKCSFCNLNLQWCGYRHKTGATMLTELSELARRHHCLDYTFTDNALPPPEADIFFESIRASNIDVRFFAEVRTIPDPEKLLAYRRGGLDTIQVGIEALSTPLLDKMQKGTTAIDNIAMLKAAQAANVRLEGNLIMEFPGSTEEEVNETLNTLESVLPYHPLAPATFFLGHGSPIASSPGMFGIQAVTAHPHARQLFPPEILQMLTLLIKGYRGDRQLQRKLWQPVREKISSWQRFHDNRHDQPPYPLSYRDGSAFLLIRQEVIDGPPLKHRLKGLSRQIYLFCARIRTLDEISAKFPTLTDSTILSFIHQLCEKRLVFREGNRVLALAIHDSNNNF